MKSLIYAFLFFALASVSYADAHLHANVTGLGSGTVGSAQYAPINITVNFYNTTSQAYPSGRNGSIFIENATDVWVRHACTTDANGNCSVAFLPDCSYTGGIRHVRGGPYGDVDYADYNSSARNITIDIGARCSETITFSIEANLGGASGDTAEVDGKGAGFYRPSNVLKYYSCMQDSSITGNPALALVFAGRDLNYINLTSGNSFVQKISQFQAGNKFMLAVTDGGCASVSAKAADISAGSLGPLSGFLNAVTRIEIALSYPGVDIVGDFAKAGRFMIGLEKNQTNVTQIIVRDL